MVQSVRADRADTRRLDDEFVDLVLVTTTGCWAEFEAIIAAEWPDWPPNAPPQRVLRGHPDPRRPNGLDDTTTTAVPWPRRPGVMRRSARQRSPPGTSRGASRPEAIVRTPDLSRTRGLPRLEVMSPR